MILFGAWGNFALRDTALNSHSAGVSIGCLIGSAALLLVMSIQCTVRCAWEVWLLANLMIHKDFKESGRLSHVVPTDMPEFQIMCVLSALEVLSMICVIVLLADHAIGKRQRYPVEDPPQTWALLDNVADY